MVGRYLAHHALHLGNAGQKIPVREPELYPLIEEPSHEVDARFEIAYVVGLVAPVRRTLQHEKDERESDDHRARPVTNATRQRTPLTGKLFVRRRSPREK